jgi:hypothetical protein
VKQWKMASDMAASLDRFCEATRKIEELKLEAAIKMQEDIRNLELEMFKLTQASPTTTPKPPTTTPEHMQTLLFCWF